MSEVVQRKNFGWLPDIPDHRDIQLYGLGERPIPGVGTAPPTLPSVIDLTNRAEWPEVYDQGNLGSCVANALAAAIEYEQIKRISANGSFAGNEFLSQKLMFRPSRLFAYYEARKIIGLEAVDSGCYIRDAMKVAYNVGVPRETGWHYDISNFANEPPTRQFMSAPYHRVTAYRKVVTVNEIRKAIAEDFPVTVGVSVFDSFYRYDSGDIPMPSYNEMMWGGHAILLVGYDDNLRRFKFRNSWGESWGTNGYGHIPYDYIANRNLADDFWVVADSEYKERMTDEEDYR